MLGGFTSADRAKQVARHTYSYDNVGNITGDGTATWTMGGKNRPTQVTVGATTTTFTINALGQRVRKAMGSSATRFVYDEAGRLWGEYDETGAAISETIWLEDLPVGVKRGTSLYYLHSDQLGTPRTITRASDNAIAWRWDNTEAFGSSQPNENPSGLGTFAYNFRFAGQYFDTETGTHYNYFRDYDPTIGRYLESDPIGLKGGLSTYAYVQGNPIALTDRTGLTCDSGSNASGLVRVGLWGIEVCTWSAVRSRGNLCAYDCPSGYPLIVLKTNPFAPCLLFWTRTMG